MDLEQNRLGQTWREYATVVMPASAPVIQRMETRRAYYAGAEAVLRLLVLGLESDDPDQPVRAVEVDRLEAIAAELDAFAASVRAGEA